MCVDPNDYLQTIEDVIAFLKDVRRITPDMEGLLGDIINTLSQYKPIGRIALRHNCIRIEKLDGSEFDVSEHVGSILYAKTKE